MNSPHQGQTVLLLGATGLVGGHCLQRLIASPEVARVRMLVRHPRRSPPAKVEVCVADFNRLEQHLEWCKVDSVICALGTTIAKAGSEAAFRQVDFDYPLQIAQLTHASGAKQFVVVSALGSDARSNVFYNRVKGELEDALTALGFDSLAIAKPSLLMGERQEFRLGERVALCATRLVRPLIPAAWRPVHADQVAAALVDAVLQPRKGSYVMANPQLLQMT